MYHWNRLSTPCAAVPLLPPVCLHAAVSLNSCTQKNFKLLNHPPYCSLSPSPGGVSAAGLPAASRLAAMLRHVLPGTASLCTTPAACAAAVRARPISASGE